MPGLRDHVADHWQTLLAQEIPGSRTVQAPSRHKLSCAARVEALDRAVEAIDGPVILCAHSAGSLTVAHWAARPRRRIHGALLATPADIEVPLPEGYPTGAELASNGWLPIPRVRLPFPAVVGASANDPLAGLERTATLAKDWGAALALLGAVGHLNPAAGFGPWPCGRTYLEAIDDADEA